MKPVKGTDYGLIVLGRKGANQWWAPASRFALTRHRVTICVNASGFALTGHKSLMWKQKIHAWRSVGNFFTTDWLSGDATKICREFPTFIRRWVPPLAPSTHYLGWLRKFSFSWKFRKIFNFMFHEIFLQINKTTFTKHEIESAKFSRNLKEISRNTKH